MLQEKCVKREQTGKGEQKRRSASCSGEPHQSGGLRTEERGQRRERDSPE